MQYSAFTSILRVLIRASDRRTSHQIYDLLGTVLVENSVLRNSTSSFASLTSSLEALESEQLDCSIVFLDNCICRVAKKPVHYQDMVSSLCEDSHGSVSLLMAAIAEQWPYLIKNNDSETAVSVATWIGYFFKELNRSGEDRKALGLLLDKLVEVTDHKKSRSPLKKAMKEVAKAEDDGGGGHEDKMSDSVQEHPPMSDSHQLVDLVEIFGALPTEGKSHHELYRWEKEELVVAVEEDHVSRLMLCLCSEYQEVRRQAFISLSHFIEKIKVSLLPLFLLLSGLPSSKLTSPRIRNTRKDGQYTFSQVNYERQ